MFKNMCVPILCRDTLDLGNDYYHIISSAGGMIFKRAGYVS